MKKKQKEKGEKKGRKNHYPRALKRIFPPKIRIKCLGGFVFRKQKNQKVKTNFPIKGFLRRTFSDESRGFTNASYWKKKLPRKVVIFPGFS